MAPDPKKKPSSPFAGLAALREVLPAAPAAAPAPAPAPAPAAAVGRDGLGGKIVVARTRKGRGGKTVTVVSGITARGAALEELARELRQALGCGAVVEEDRILVQGEQEPRVRAFLESRGARRVVIGT